MTFKSAHIYIGIYCRSKLFELQFAYSFKGNMCVKVIKDLKAEEDLMIEYSEQTSQGEQFFKEHNVNYGLYSF